VLKHVPKTVSRFTQKGINADFVANGDIYLFSRKLDLWIMPRGSDMLILLVFTSPWRSPSLMVHNMQIEGGNS
jgi:hypothetical protein